MIYQDYMIENGAGGAADAFFELANMKSVEYMCKDGQLVTISQDPEIQDCTGGIVWETSFLLATFLEHWLDGYVDPSDELSVLEVGSGCGLLGLALAHAGCRVVMTETSVAIQNLKENVNTEKNVISLNQRQRPKAMLLSWEKPKERRACLEAAGAPFDLIVGTDVVFSEPLVRPLLETMHQLSHSKTVIWLCLQERCQAAHALLLKLATEYFNMEDCTESLCSCPGCGSAKELECIMLRFTAKDANKRDLPPNDDSENVGNVSGVEKRFRYKE